MSTEVAVTETPIAVKSVEFEVVRSTDLESISKAKTEVDIRDTNSVINWGTGAQKQVGNVTGQMLEGVKSKDAGEVGDMLVGMVTQIRGLDFSKVQPGKEVGFFGKLLGKVTPIAEFIQSFEEIRSHVNTVVNNLETKKVGLSKSVKQLDLLYSTALEYFYDLGNYITAGEEMIAEMDSVTIPKMQEEAKGGDMIKAQELNDFIASRDAFERRVHDLKLTRQVVMQNLPAIRMIQKNDTDLIAKINTQMVNTIPAWEMQLAMAVKMWESADAMKDSKALSDMQNDVLEANAAMLRQSNAAIRGEVERGAYDIESIKKANDDLVAAIEESITIAKEGKQKRLAASAELGAAEAKLKQALLSAAA